jgi:3' terminal RNA ribose 2'-O-methyltransferase Hen1
LQDRRILGVVEALRAAGATAVADVGCGEGDLIASLARETQIDRVIGTDVAVRELERTKARLERVPLAASRRERIELFQSSVLYADRRLAGLDAITLLEVIEHVEPSRLDSLAQVIFACAHPRNVLMTTPNREYNVLFPAVGEGRLRHADHRFEWTRAEFRTWSERIAAQFGYRVDFKPIGDEDAIHGAPSQMAVFRCA